MVQFVPWDSMPLHEWSTKYAGGNFIDLDGYSTHYIEKGSGEPVILLHGFYFDSYMWNKNIDVLAEQFKVYAMDLWGFGYSTREPVDYDYSLYAHQLLKFMDALNIDRASLVGQSMGAGTLVYFSARHRERVHKLILVAPAGMPNPLPLIGKITNLPGVGEFLFGLKNNFVRRAVLGSSFFHNKDFITDNYFENVVRFHKIEGTTPAMLQILRNRFFDTLKDDIHTLGEMDMPILLVCGRQDKSVPCKCGLEMYRILNGSHLEVFEKAGHCPHDEQWEKFNRIAIDFLS
jgi:pimeloyl-ACP methyl ester carboxylesterase